MMYNSSLFQRPTVVTPPMHLKGSSAKGGVGNFYGNGRFAWVSDGKRVEVFSMESGQRVSGWSRPNANIICVAEMCISPQRSLLLFGLLSDGKHVLAVFDPNISMVTRALSIPAPIVIVHAVSPTNPEMPGLFASTFLKHFSGVVAVGCRGGHVYLVDLRLCNGSSIRESVSHPHPIYVVGWQQACDGPWRAIGVHGAVQLTEPNTYAFPFSDGCQEFMCEKDVTFDEGDVAVTALHYVPHLYSLMVGYSFGYFQVFPLTILTSSFSCPYQLMSPDANPPPVTHFAYQEPENDPKSFVYLWVARGPCAFTGSARFNVSITLCRLVYELRVRTSMPLGYYYETLLEVQSVLEHSLSPLPSLSTRSVGASHLFQCNTLERRRNSHRRDGPHDDSTGSSCDLTLASFVWSSCEGDSTHYFLGLFDLNQWYHAQMPRGVRWRQVGKHSGVLGCSYFAFFVLDSALNGQLLQDGQVSSATNFSFLPPVPETHMWPTSLAFDFKCMFGGSSVVHCKFLGLQRAALYELKRLRAAAFAEPQRLFSLCEQAELLNAVVEHEQRDLALQRKALLSVCLENDLTSILLQCAQMWKLTDVLRSEYGPHLVLQWIDQTLNDLLEENTNFCSSAFEENYHPVEPSVMCRGHNILVNLRHLSTLIQHTVHIFQAAEHEQLYAEIMAHYQSCVINAQLLDIILWFTSNGLLPCTSDPGISAHGGGGGGGFHYPADALRRQYGVLRSRCPRLAIDHLTQELIDDQNPIQYPPRTLKDLISIFSGLNTLAQHCVIIYFLHDMKGIGDTFQQLVTSYVVTFALSKPLAVFVEVLWQLDHDLPQNSVGAMIMSQPLPKEWFPWQHEIVVRNLLCSGHTRLAVQYISHYDTLMADLDGTKLKIEVLVAQGCISGAFEMVRSMGVWQEEATRFLLDQCYGSKQLHKVLDLSLEGYKSLVCSYLEAHSTPSVLVPLSYTRSSKPRSGLIQILEPRDRAACRGDILLGYSKALPQTLQGTASQTVLSNPPQVQRVKAEQPLEPLTRLTARVVDGRPPLSTKAGLLVAVMEKVAEARMESSQAFTPLKRSPVHVPFLSTPVSVKSMHTQLNAGMSNMPATTPKSKSIVLPTSFSNAKTADTIAQFILHLQDFRNSISTPQQSGALDVTHLKSSVMPPRPPFYLSPGIATRNTPHSILKMKPLLPEEEDTAPAPASPEGTRVETVAMAAMDHSASNNRKIRFAVEGKPLKSPSPDHPPVRSLDQYRQIPVPASSSPCLRLAQSTPLPLETSSPRQLPKLAAIPLIWDCHVTGNGMLPTAAAEGHPGDGLEMGEEVEVGVRQEQEEVEQHQIEQGEGEIQRDREVKESGMETGQGETQVQEEIEVEQEGVEQVHEEVELEQEGVEQVQEEVELEQMEQVQEEVEVEQEVVEQVQEEVEVEQEGVEQVQEEVQVEQIQEETTEERVVQQLQEEMEKVQAIEVQYEVQRATHRRKSGKKEKRVQAESSFQQRDQSEHVLKQRDQSEQVLKQRDQSEHVLKQRDQSEQVLKQRDQSEQVLKQRDQSEQVLKQQEQVPKPVVLRHPTKSKQQVQRSEEQKQDVVSGEPVSREEDSHHLLRKAQRGQYSLPTLRRTAFSGTTTSSSQQSAVPLARHTPPPPVLDTPTTLCALPGEEEVSHASTSLKITSHLETTSHLTQASLTPSSSASGREKRSFFEPIMESDIRSIKRKKGIRLHIKRLSELKPKKAKQLNETAEQGDVAVTNQPAPSDVAQQQQSYTFSHPAAIVSSSKPIGGPQETKGPSLPTKEFVFSPPMTRSRLRRLQEGTDSKDSSFVSQTSVTTPVSSRVQAREFPTTPHVQSSMEQLFLLTPPAKASTPAGSSQKPKAKPLTTIRKRERLVTKK
eukprot:Em0008g1267a